MHACMCVYHVCRLGMYVSMVLALYACRHAFVCIAVVYLCILCARACVRACVRAWVGGWVGGWVGACICAYMHILFIHIYIYLHIREYAWVYRIHTDRLTD